MKVLKTAVKLVITFIIVLIILILLLVGVTAIPNSVIKDNQTNAINIINSEGDYPAHFFPDPVISDNFTDRIIIEHTLNNEQDSVLEAAMHGDYARYWHGYCVVLRPLLMFFSFYQIRYIAMISYTVLLGCAAVLIAKRVNIRNAVAFLLAIAMTFPVVVMTSLQFLPVFLISFAAIILEMLFPSLMKEKAAAFFMIIGMVTSFVDLLTAPILTLGLPLIVLIIGVKEDESSLKIAIKRLIGLSAMWVLGYGLNWACKWVLASVILKKDVLSDAVSAAEYRVMGNDDYLGGRLPDRVIAIKMNIKMLLFLHNYWVISIIIALLVILILIYALIKKKRKCLMLDCCALTVAFYPYLWYIVLSNHSIMHRWFTCRAQAITVFAVLTVLLNQFNLSFLVEQPNVSSKNRMLR